VLLDRLPNETETRRKAVEEILKAEPMRVPADPTELCRELDAAHDRSRR
jgi:hypothetical protein